MTKKELVNGIKAFWSNAMTAAKCQWYMEHTHVVQPKIIDCKGGITGEQHLEQLLLHNIYLRIVARLYYYFHCTGCIYDI